VGLLRSAKGHALFSANYGSFVNTSRMFLTGLAIAAFATFTNFNMQVIECNEPCNLEGAYWAGALIAFLDIDLVVLLWKATKARTSAPFHIELTSSGIHIVKWVKAREKVLIPWGTVTKVELRIKKWKKKEMGLVFLPKSKFTAVDIYTAKGDVEEIYIHTNDLPNLVGALKELGVAVVKS